MYVYETYSGVLRVHWKKKENKENKLLPAGFEPATFALLQHPRRILANTAYKYDALTDCATGAGYPRQVQENLLYLWRELRCKVQQHLDVSNISP